MTRGDVQLGTTQAGAGEGWTGYPSIIWAEVGWWAVGSHLKVNVDGVGVRSRARSALLESVGS